ncbi:hypothetical protein G6F46_009266 [Rhizopus delemar]|uniref:Uncharacterized protein n=2 Tax=Rhizopus TaxID=4842 RepID=A0A9P6YUN3_9FUNG|nr:hypothetical protein G6F55_008168 [Rhizopus delemar]KAG1536875.1 hypothetical protein G6F51_010710 [Rhizopus arrhizus]KAG1489663.1 hypothetical protein G6F54_011273 [Rhizopus delemar]KAG1512358.1 hypothetical protein G6F53_005247 [Rhizopus delemar]KAG1518784.1 hypothetical protein G6F52_008960 [Rhizopus delemar]
MKEIYSEIILITDLFNDKSVKSFSAWCGMAKLNFVSIEQQRKYQKNEQKTRRHLLWVLKKEHQEPIEDAECGPKSQSENASTKLRLLDSMVDRLIKDYSVDMMSASYSSTSKQPFADHDRTDPVHVPKSSGNTQDLLRLLSIASRPIAIIAIDFARLTTNTNDLIQPLRDHEIVKTVLIDKIYNLF